VILANLGALLALLLGRLDADELVAVQIDNGSHCPTVSGCLVEFFSDLRNV
jgi:hypothetical protein